MAKIVMYADQKAVQFKKALDKAKICYTFQKKPDPYNDVLLHFHVESINIDRAVQIKRQFTKKGPDQLRARIY